MNMSIVEGVLRGGLRPGLLKNDLSERELIQISRSLRKISSDENLRKIENILIDVLEPMGFVKIKEMFSQQHSMLSAAEAFSPLNGFGSRIYTPARTAMSFDGVVEMKNCTNPFHRFYALLVDSELIRMRKFLHDMCLTLRNDSLMRNELKDLLRNMTVYCQEASKWENDSEIMLMLAAKLTQFYFELLGVYHDLLYQGGDAGLIDDFRDFVYLWRREDPTDEELERFNNVSCKTAKPETIKQVEPQMESLREIQKPQPSNDVTTESGATNNKYDALLAALEGQSEGFLNYGFFNLPKVSGLSLEQQKKLLSAIAFRETDCAAHAVAMFCFLEYDTKLIGEYGLNKTKLYNYWGKLLAINERKIRGNYQTVRNANTSEDTELYKAQKYFDKVVEKEYNAILNGKP